MEREILLSGVGGQGVQLAANVLAHAALAEGRDVQLFGSYGGMMRGGNTDAELVVADDRITAPPTVGSAWAAVLLHPDYADPVLARGIRTRSAMPSRSDQEVEKQSPRSSSGGLVETDRRPDRPGAAAVGMDREPHLA